MRLAGGEEVLVAADGLAEALRRREDEPVVAVGTPVEALDLVDEPLAPARPVAGGVELPAPVQVRAHVLLGREPAQDAERLLHACDLRPADRGRAHAGGEALEPEPGGVDLLEVLAREPADDGTAGGRDRDEALALELAEAGADRGRRDAELLREVALHERRPLGELPVDDQLAKRARDLLLDRLALLERGDRRDISGPSMRRQFALCSPVMQFAIANRK